VDSTGGAYSAPPDLAGFRGRAPGKGTGKGVEREGQREGVGRGKRKGDLLHGSRGTDAPWHVHLRGKKTRKNFAV